MAHTPRYCVFRIVNEARKEIYLAVSPQPIFEAISRIRDHRPAALRSWKLDDVAKFESLEFRLTKASAMAFVKMRVRNGTRRGYRYILDLDVGPRPER